jgi:hypothetical protein
MKPACRSVLVKVWAILRGTGGRKPEQALH